MFGLNLMHWARRLVLASEQISAWRAEMAHAGLRMRATLKCARCFLRRPPARLNTHPPARPLCHLTLYPHTTNPTSPPFVSLFGRLSSADCPKGQYPASVSCSTLKSRGLSPPRINPRHRFHSASVPPFLLFPRPNLHLLSSSKPSRIQTSRNRTGRRRNKTFYRLPEHTL